jgi:hypothetical protein
MSPSKVFRVGRRRNQIRIRRKQRLVLSETIPTTKPSSKILEKQTEILKYRQVFIVGKPILGLTQKEEKSEHISPAPKSQRIEDGTSVELGINALTQSGSGRYSKKRKEHTEY